MKNDNISILAKVMSMLIIGICMLTPAVYAQTVPLFISGHVMVNGVNMAGAVVSAGNSQYTTGSSGYYQLCPGITNGSSVTVMANYQGHTSSSTVTQNGQGSVTVDLGITYTPSPSPSPSSSPSSSPSPSPSPSSSPSSSPSTAPTVKPTTAPTTAPTVKPTTAPNITVTATVKPTLVPSHPGGQNGTGTNSTTPNLSATPTLSVTPTPTPETVYTSLNFCWIPLLLIFIVIAAAYLYSKRKKK